MKNYLSVIPARGGSKGIKNKNLKLIDGKPLIYYTIDVCRNIFDKKKILVSTDNKEISDYCSTLELNTSYLRPHSLSQDNSPMAETVLHAVDWYNKNNKENVSNILLLQPTSPLRTVKEIENAIYIYKKRNLQSLVSVSPVINHPYECIKINDLNKCLNWNYLIKEKEKVHQRQKYANNYMWVDGSIYLCSYSFLKNNNSFLVHGKTYPFVTSNKYSIDIDDYHDFEIAKLIIEKEK